MEKRPNNEQLNINQSEDYYNIEFNDRYYRIALGIVCLILVVIAFIMMAAGAIGLIWLTKFVFA